MKKTLAILLSCVLLVAAFFAVAMITSADASEVYASTVEVTLADGSTVYLGKQPTFGTGEDAGKIVGYQDDNILNILALKEGTMKFDETTGTLTIDGVKGVKKVASYTGSMVLVVKGTNTIENDKADDNAVQVNYANGDKTLVGNLIIKGDGTLNAISPKYTLCSNCGSIEITDKVTVNVESTFNGTNATADAIHVSNGGNANFIKFSGNCKVVAKANTHSAIRTNQAGSAVYITENADVEILLVQRQGWGGGVVTQNFEMTGGTLDINVENESSAKVAAITGLNVQEGSANLKGGTIKVNVNNKYSNRGYGIFFKNTKAIKFEGSVVDVTVKNATAASNNAMIATQGSSTQLDVTGGKLSFSGDANTTGLFGVNVNNCTVNISGGTITGTARSFAYSQGANMTFNITGGNIDVTSTVSNYTESSAKTFTQSGTVTMDKAGTTFKNGTVGAVNPTSTTCSKASLLAKTPVEVADKPTATVSPVIKLADNTVVTVTATAPYVGNTEIISVAGNKATQATKEFTAAPAAPVNIKFTNITTTGATVTWDATENATAYAVYVGGQKVGETDKDTFNFALTGLTEKTQYKVQVEASNQIGTSPKSAEVTLTTATEGVAASVTIVPATGDAVELNASNTTYNGATGTAVFDAATGTVTINNLTGVQSITAAADVALTVTAKGTNSLESASATNSLYAGHLTVNGDGKLSVKNTKTDAYPILGGHSLTFAGSLEFSLTSTTSKHAVHVSRGNNEVGVADFVAKENVKITLNTAKNAISVNGEKTSLIITDNAVVNITNTSGDALSSVADKDLSYEGKPGAYTEISGNAKVTVVSGSCGIRNRYCADTAGLKTMEGTADVVIKDNANVDISAVGQVIYSYCDPGKGVDTDKASFTMTGNPTVKLTNTKNYQGFQIKGDDNTVTLNGGTLEIYAPEKTAFSNDGKTTWVVNHVKTMVAGDDAASAAKTDEINTSAKYFKIVMNNPNTSDNVISVVAVVLAISAVAVAAAVVLRKRSYNA